MLNFNVSEGGLAGPNKRQYVLVNGEAPYWLFNFIFILLHFDFEVCELRHWISKSDQSGGTLAQPIRRQYVMTNRGLPVTISYCQISIWSSLGLDIGFEKAIL